MFGINQKKVKTLAKMVREGKRQKPQGLHDFRRAQTPRLQPTQRLHKLRERTIIKRTQKAGNPTSVDYNFFNPLKP